MHGLWLDVHARQIGDGRLCNRPDPAPDPARNRDRPGACGRQLLGTADQTRIARLEVIQGKGH
ncbi:MAG: hypothetical protein WBA82_10980, partial [Castellaniella sp.]|uniref:hypothetical protein n=1 Tax=Castellaniella sp. TaxID=1955812 RepID=UPI003C718CFB